MMTKIKTRQTSNFSQIFQIFRFYLFYCIFRLVFHLLDFVPLLNALGFCTTVDFFQFHLILEPRLANFLGPNRIDIGLKTSTSSMTSSARPSLNAVESKSKMAALATPRLLPTPFRASSNLEKGKLV